MEFADLLANLGGSELTKEEKKRAVKWGLLNMGAGILANNRGNYGDFAPALGAGINQGLLGYQTQLGREEAGAKKRKQSELMRNAFTSAITPGQTFQQLGTPGESYVTQDKSVADMIAAQNQDINQLNAMPVEQPVQTFGMGFTPPPVGMMTGGTEMPFNANRPRVPGQNVTRPPEPMTEAEQGLYGMTPIPPPTQTMPSMANVPMLPTDYQTFSQPEQFDMLKAARQLMQSGDPELMQEGFKIYAGISTGKDGRTSEIKNWEFAQGLTPEQRAEFLAKNGGNMPSAVQEFQYLQTLTPQERALWFENKRAAQIMNLGGTMAVRQPMGGVKESYGVTLRPGETPAIQGAQEAAKVVAREEVQKSYDAPKARTKLAATEAKSKMLQSTIDKAIKQSGFWSTGIMAQALSGVGNTLAKDLASTLNTIKANMGFEELQQMRDNSPTGGALGQVAVQEINFLQSVVASLDQAQSNEQLIENLKIVKEAKRQSDMRVRQAYKQTYEGQEQQGTPKKKSIDELWD